jgi:hypothetical protein
MTTAVARAWPVASSGPCRPVGYATQPGWGRLRVPKGASLVLAARVGGQNARVAHRCLDCATVVVPPDPTYDHPAT